MTNKNNQSHNSKITKNGSTHRCIMNGDDSDPFITSHNFKITKDLITWIDTNHTWKSDLIITLQRIGNKMTRINMVVMQRQNLIQRMIYNTFKKKGIAQFFEGSLIKLNTYCKELQSEGRDHTSRLLLEPSTNPIL